MKEGLSAGVQTLGGVFFCIVDAESKSATNIVNLTEAAVNHLDAQISVGFLSGLSVTGASATGKKDTGTGESNSKFGGSYCRFRLRGTHVCPPQ